MGMFVPFRREVGRSWGDWMMVTSGSRDDLMDLFLERARGDIGLVKRALEDVASRAQSEDEISFEKVIERIDALMPEEV